MLYDRLKLLFYSLWIIHYTPRYIEVIGTEMKEIFVLFKTFSYEVFDICIHRLVQLDKFMYGSEKKSKMEAHHGVRFCGIIY